MANRVQPQQNLIDRDYLIEAMRSENPNLSQITLETYYGDISRHVESILAVFSTVSISEALGQTEFKEQSTTAIKMAKKIVSNRRKWTLGE